MDKHFFIHLQRLCLNAFACQPFFSLIQGSVAAAVIESSTFSSFT